MPTDYQYLFGPVPSRRFGRSLGVDLIPLKTCTLNCIFCEVGRTTHQTMERREYVPTEAVVAELDRWLDEGGEADVVTLAGSGEPTLHTRFGEVLRAIGGRGHKAVLLSNGTLMPVADVRAGATEADIVKLSLSAWDQASYDRIHRPHAGVLFADVVHAYRAFRSQFGGELWLEVFVVPGLNDRDEDAERIAAYVATVGADRIDLNTAVRPTAARGVSPVAVERLHELAAIFGPRAEVAATYRSDSTSRRRVTPETVAAIVRRRPCTAAQLAASLGVTVDVVQAAIDTAVTRGDIQPEPREDAVYYVGESREGISG